MGPHAGEQRSTASITPATESRTHGKKKAEGERRKPQAVIEEIHLGQPAAYWLIAHLSPPQRRTPDGRERSCPSPGMRQVEYAAGELMDVSTARAIW